MASSSSRSSSWVHAFTVIVGVHAALFMSAGTGRAESCAREIAVVQAAVDSALELVASAGPTRAESRAARLHHQPTPAAIARAEQERGLNRGEQALQALERARAADRAGDLALCRSALAEARRAMGSDSEAVR